jgi:hypothetical protein
VTTPAEPTPEELLDVAGADEAITNLGVVAHWLAEDAPARARFARWLAVSHDVLMPDCGQPMPRPGRDAALAEPWQVIPGGWG